MLTEEIQMAALSEQDRFDLWANFMEAPPAGEVFSCTKADLRDAANALDDFLVANATAINNALPAAAKAALSTSQKARLLNLVVAKRYIKGA